MNKLAKICMAGWTIFCFVGACNGIMNVSNSTQGHELGGAEALGTGIGLFIWLIAWAVPMVVFGIIALVTKPAPTNVPSMAPQAPPRLCGECGKYYGADAFSCPFCGSVTSSQNIATPAVNPLLLQAQQGSVISGQVDGSVPRTISPAEIYGRKARNWAQQHRPLVICLVILAIIGAIALVSSGPSNTSSNSTQPSPSEPESVGAPNAMRVTAMELFSAYQRNEVLADSQYKRKELIVTGTVAEIRKDMFDEAVVDLATANEFESVLAYLGKGEETKAATLSKGMSVTLLCEGGGATMGSPDLRNCRFVPEGYSAQPLVERTTVADKTGEITPAEIANMTYILGSGQYARSVKFADGRAHWDTESYGINTKSIVYGNLNGIEQRVAVVTMDYNGGGSGIFISLVAVWNASGTLMNSEEKDLGDRVVVNSVAMNDGLVTVDMLTQGPNDGMCCPTQRKILRLALRGNRFVDL